MKTERFALGNRGEFEMCHDVLIHVEIRGEKTKIFREQGGRLWDGITRVTTKAVRHAMEEETHSERMQALEDLYFQDLPAG